MTNKTPNYDELSDAYEKLCEPLRGVTAILSIMATAHDIEDDDVRETAYFLLAQLRDAHWQADRVHSWWAANKTEEGQPSQGSLPSGPTVSCG